MTSRKINRLATLQSPDPPCQNASDQVVVDVSNYTNIYINKKTYNH